MPETTRAGGFRRPERCIKMSKLTGKHVVLGVTASVAIYKACELVRILVKSGAKVRAIMTEHATELVRPTLFETLTGNAVYVEMFPDKRESPMSHINLSDWADLFVVAPATANFIGKAASGIADDLLSTSYLAMDVPVVIAPAMNNRMWNDASVQANIKALRKHGVRFVGPGVGELASGDSGEGRLAEIDEIYRTIEEILAIPGPLSGKKVVVTAGPTREYIDDVRFLSNPSTGKMGFALAEVASSMDAQVILIYGQTGLEPPDAVYSIPVTSAAEMSEAVKTHFEDADIIIMAAAVADWTVDKHEGKLKKSGREALAIELKPTEDILFSLGQNKGNKLLVGFAVETENEVENARKKLAAKNLDMIFVNNPKDKGTGFAAETNSGVLITAEEEENIPLVSKNELARVIINRVVLRLKNG
ncbi:bifunctional phosphopantothenoylcysteine decarboxylase/phosphopantothenate--cysteine ligase CoaBC [bacterium]|nr:MAG: bifunctional phosphopantothenoylcysteine decarboxylase/phosphopantothenate--cysteine ligase CoaBC [bacterium]